MINENDVVTAKRDLSGHVHAGCRGTVLLVYEDPSLAYEVEFVDSEGNTIDLLTVLTSDVENE